MPDDLTAKMKARNIHISLRGGAIRISPYLFNDFGDIDTFFAALDEEL